MVPLLQFIDYVLGLYMIVVIAWVIMSWLVAFDVINLRQTFVRALWDAFGAMTEPFLKPIRRFMPDLRGLDLSPVILLLAVIFLRDVVIHGWLIPIFR